MNEKILSAIAPNPIPFAMNKTEEMKKFREVSDYLAKAGITGEDNIIETYNILGIKPLCD